MGQPTYRHSTVSLITFLVEDSITIRETLIPTLEELANVRVVGTAETENEAIVWLQNHPDEWALAVVDLFLKEGSGLGILKQCRTRLAQQRVVVLTNYATAEIRSRCLALGADAVFDKSNELEDFLDFCRKKSP